MIGTLFFLDWTMKDMEFGVLDPKTQELIATTASQKGSRNL